MSKSPTMDFKIIDEIPTKISPQQLTNSTQGNRSSRNQNSLRKHKPSVAVIEELSLEDSSSIESEEQQISKGSSFRRHRHGSKQSNSSNSNASGRINNIRSSQQSNKYPRTPRNSIAIPTVHQSRGISNDSTQQNGRLSGSQLSSNPIAAHRAGFVFVNAQGEDNFAFSGSREPSMRANSVISLPVIREQYCCFQRWTRTERTLMKAIGILASVIIGLAIAVILLAYHRDHEDKKHMQMGRATSARFMWTL